MENENVPQEDIIDLAVLEIVDSLVGPNASEDDIDDCVDEIFQLIENLEDEGQIRAIPENDASQEEMSSWISECLPIVKQAIKTLQSEEPQGI